MAGQLPKPSLVTNSFWDQFLSSPGATGDHADAGASVHGGDPLSLGLASAAEASAAKLVSCTDPNPREWSLHLPCSPAVTTNPPPPPPQLPFQAAEAHQLRYPAQPEPTNTAEEAAAPDMVEFQPAWTRERAERGLLQHFAEAARHKSHPITLARAKNKARAINATVVGAASAGSTSSDQGSGSGSDGKMSSDTPPPEEEEMGQLDTCEVPSELEVDVASAQPTHMAEPSSSTQGQGRRKRARRNNKIEPRSGVWLHFTRLRDGGGNATGQAECKHCRDRLISRHGTSSLWKHVDVCSAAAQEAAAAGVVAGAARPPPRRPGDMPDRRLPGMEEASKHLARMIVSRGYDASLVEDDGFRTFVAILNPEFRIPSRAAIKEMCDGILRVDGGTSSEPQHTPANSVDVNPDELREWLFQ